ncbi:methyl-accepting chemotaxis protein [Diaphorobacter sp.]|uniref:methyl-accepting chemotaxis protein n=1 Tax=Diaphorobacter sp. TaxID=1934310 RepID=UPI003D0F7E4F
MNIDALIRNFTIRLRMIGAIAVVLGLLGLLGSAGMVGMFRIHGLSQEFIQQPHEAVKLLGQLRGEMGEIRQHEKDMIIHYERPESVRTAHDRWLAALDRTKKVTDSLGNLWQGEDLALVQDLSRHLVAYREQFAHVARQLEAGGYDTATVANRMSGRAVEQFAGASEKMAALDKRILTEVDAALERQASITTNTKWLFALAVLLTVAVVVPLTLMNMVSICRPLEVARKMAQSIAGGDLSQRIEVHGRDEVADLQRALMEMQDGLGALVSQVRDASGSIASASQEIATGNQDLSVRTEQTASNAQEAVAALSQLTATVQQTASSSQVANQLVASASGIATQGGQVVQQAVASMHDISASSRKIADIIGVIDGIAFQTNILALNAAVEAARAGEQGRGFAVVASEVRSLAQRSAGAAKEIKGLISSSVQAVDGGVRHVEDAGKAMQEIVTSVQRVNDIIGEISSAAAEQASGIGAVNASVGEIDRMTQQNAALVEQSAAAAESLRDQAARLSQVVQQFQLSHAQHAAVAARRMPASGASAALNMAAAQPRLGLS